MRYFDKPLKNCYYKPKITGIAQNLTYFSKSTWLDFLKGIL